MSSAASLADLASPDAPLVLLGAGKMGGALLSGWLARGLSASAVVALDPAPPEEVATLIAQHGIRQAMRAGEVAAVALLAVKPQVAADVCPVLAPAIGAETLVVSVMAGKTLSFMQGTFPQARRLVRSIPNTPAAVGRGVTVCAGSAALDDAGRAAATALLSAVGIVEWVEDEGLIDAATAVSGSGPAYAFLLAEALAEAGVRAGLPAELSARIARGTVAGAGELLHASDIEAGQLRRNVTSPKGTTAAALNVLMDEARGFGPLLTEAVAAAAKRSRELAG